MPARRRQGRPSRARSSRPARWLVAVVVAGGGLAAPGGAAAGAGTVPSLANDVTLTAPATGYLRVRLTRTLDLTRFNYLQNPPAFSGPGSVGVAFLPDRLGSLARNLVIVRVKTAAGYALVEGQAQGRDPKTGQEGAPRLLPGTYRLFFLTLGAGSVRMRLPGQPAGTQRLVARTRVPWHAAETRAPVDATASAPPAWETTLDFAGRAPGYLFAALWVHSPARVYARFGGCYYGPGDDRGEPLCGGGRHHGGVEAVGPRTEVDWLWHASIFDRPPGSQAFRAYYVSGGRATAAGAVMFFLPQA